MGAFPALRSVAVYDSRLAYLERGSGESLVFVHGSSQDLRTWSQQVDGLSASYRTIAYSRRYARPNPDIAPGVDDQMQPHVDDLLEVLRGLNAAPAHLVGSSWGGFICLLAAMQAPAAVRSLVLCEPPVLPLFISNDPGPVEIISLFLRRPVDAYRIARFGLGVIEPVAKAYRAGDIERGGRIFGEAVLGKGALEAMPAGRRQMVQENDAAEIAQFLGAGFPPLRADDVRRVTAPTLLVAGARSPAVLRKTLNGELARLLPNAERAEVPNASHLMHEENASEFNAAVTAFLSRQAQR